MVGDQDGIEVEHFVHLPHEERPRAGIYSLEQWWFQEEKLFILQRSSRPN